MLCPTAQLKSMLSTARSMCRSSVLLSSGVIRVELTTEALTLLVVS